MVPEGWVKYSGSDITSKITKGSSPKWQGFEYQNNGTLFVTSENVRDGYLDVSSPKFLPFEFNQKLKNSQLQYDDILINIVGASIGRSCQYLLTGQQANINQAVCLFRTNELALSDYVRQFLQLPSTIKRLLGTQSESARPNLSLADMRDFVFILPPLPEQKKIAQILSTWDKAITTTEQLLTNSQQQKKALMQQLLTGEKRLLDKNGARFSGEWQPTKLSKIFERVTTKNQGRSTNVVTISGRHGLIRQEDFFKKSVASETLDGYFLLRKGQFAYNKSYSNGYPMGAIKRLNRYVDGVVTTLYICFELSQPTKADSDFWEHYFESGLLNKGLSQIAHEGGRAHGLLNVKPADFFSLKVPIPAIEEQQKIAAVLSTADQEITTLQQKLDALKLEKKALMQQLLTGQRRIQL